jgi:putative FmdB family regulatory protein
LPIYEYLCRRCNRIYSFLFATMSDEGSPVCPRCGAVDLEREVSLFAFVRGGTDPLAAIPKSEESGQAGQDVPAGTPAAGDQPPVRDPGLYRQDWDGRFEHHRKDRE